MSDRPYTDPERLYAAYWDERQTTAEIAAQWDCAASTIRTWMQKHGIERRNRGQSPTPIVGYATHSSLGYVELRQRDPDGTRRGCYAHQLLALAVGQHDGDEPHPECLEAPGCTAPGVCPYNVFSNGRYQIHHESGIEWDNRPENLVQVEHEEHYGHHLHDTEIEDGTPVTEETAEPVTDGGTPVPPRPRPSAGSGVPERLHRDRTPHENAIRDPKDEYDQFAPQATNMELVCPWCGELLRHAPETVTIDGRRGPPGYYQTTAVTVREYHPNCLACREYVRRRVENYTFDQFSESV